MERARLIDELPEPLAVALRLDEGGYDAAAVATALDIAAEGVAAVLQLARQKLAALQEPEALLQERNALQAPDGAAAP